MKEKPGIRQIATILQRELSSRFEKLMKPSCVSFEPVYIEATLLDPRFKIVLTRDQQEAAKLQLLHDVLYVLTCACVFTVLHSLCMCVTLCVTVCVCVTV